ncbi:hypothetical protein ACOZ38_25305 [Sphaerisporangium viridialbum]|uniref:hypothetical protein n=1 Tax=Sphaerisporangium viridialbum TaxID=46189 RepID=UPI003C7455C1
MPWWHTTDHDKQDGHRKGVLMHRGFWVHEVPRLILWCRIRGHRPVVDGFGVPGEHNGHVARWVCCDRCGVRPDPQGSLDPNEYQVGQPYDGPYVPVTRIIAADMIVEMLGLKGRPEHADDAGKPGPWPGKPTGTLGAEVVVGRTFGVFSAEVTVGSAGSEHVLSGHLRMWPFGAFYWHTEGFGAWLQRRLIPTGYDSREIQVSIGDWAVRWSLWAREGHWSRSDPRWMSGRVSLDLVEKLLGPKRYSYEEVGDPRMGLVAMPEGDSHWVRLKLKRVRLGRPRRRRAEMSWSVEWDSREGIPYRRSWKGDATISASVEVSGDAVEQDRWVEDACAAIAAAMSKQRTRYGWRPAATEMEQ